MALLNPRYEDIGKEFVTQYYLLFDDPASRPNLIHLFNVSISLKFIVYHNYKTINSILSRFEQFAIIIFFFCECEEKYKKRKF